MTEDSCVPLQYLYIYLYFLVPFLPVYYHYHLSNEKLKAFCALSLNIEFYVATKNKIK